MYAISVAAGEAGSETIIDTLLLSIIGKKTRTACLMGIKLHGDQRSDISWDSGLL